VPARDPDALAAAIVRVLGDPALGERLSAAGRRRVEEKFTVDAMVDGTLAVYRDLVAGGPSA
jgi:glycosyltransferase involved in cell wall biosynthesis